ncbi:hypothetical protein SAMN04487881_0030 [Marinobacter sp. es.048]|uniref:hypothetical protein n=1 Tax=Marinobacter sp. es.048 TaxID=1761795 RepID=UPI000B59109D|nr:hypothetical protein [Marinobacter sp. es.048]SNC59307.1 hypothetical protein SAMN04487881_0030 [Marinobacter sp. es.048]
MGTFLKYALEIPLCFYFMFFTPKADYRENVESYLYGVVVMACVQCLVMVWLMDYFGWNVPFQRDIQEHFGYYVSDWEFGFFIGFWTLLGGLQYPSLMEGPDKPGVYDEDYAFSVRMSASPDLPNNNFAATVREDRTSGQQKRKDKAQDKTVQSQPEKVIAASRPEKTDAVWSGLLLKKTPPEAVRYLTMIKCSLDENTDPKEYWGIEEESPLFRDRRWVEAEMARLMKLTSEEECWPTRQ